ncbi:CPBP family intramembrane glutamic endopeptidase [Pseudoruegeria sp. SK021]|uniref:CPBP family intramembrane glutamic endopeptidase n=1 Tax=Pseudoruegeria sp. SK021 TaxID=1933035 RepID=UPI000A25F03A|nr:CPBP family intramembrane glutamic endopeptidase [Pseudoruegeria sp. SK021]OSP54661.1 hypothetical protein BV911_11735 [Pseudoruegeria sp. SK021]
MSSAFLPAAFDAFLAPARRSPALWRTALGFGLVIGVYVGLNLAAFGALALIWGFNEAAEQASHLSDPATPVRALALLATFVPMALAPMITVRVLHRRRPGTLFGPARRTAGDFFQSAAVLFGIQALLIALSGAATETLPNLSVEHWMWLLPVTLVAVAGQTLSEELVFRGYLQQQLAVRFASRVIWMGLPSLLFASLHYSPGTLGQSATFAVFAAFLFGLAAADLTARTGSIGAAWGVHFANNFFAIAIFASEGTITGLALRIAPEADPQVSAFHPSALMELLPLALSWLILRRWLRR